MNWRAWFCRHRHYRRERVQGRVVLTCDSCGRQVPAIDRTSKERKAMTKRYPQPKALQAQGHEKVTPIRRAQ